MSSKKSTSKSKKSTRQSKKSTRQSKKSTSKLLENLDYGIYDPDGLNLNPLTMEPYKNLYSNKKKKY